MSAALDIPRKWVGRGQVAVGALISSAPAKDIVADEATRGEAVDAVVPHLRLPLPTQFAPPSGEGDAAGHGAFARHTTSASSNSFTDLDSLVADLVGDGFDPETPDLLGGAVEADPSLREESERGLVNVVAPDGDAALNPSVRKDGETGRRWFVPHDKHASLETPASDDGGIDCGPPVTPRENVDPELIAAIQSLHREHRGLQNAVTAMTLRIKADERWRAAARIRSEGGTLDGSKFPKPTQEDVDAILLMRPRYYAARAGIEALRKECLKELLTATKMLPVAKWVVSVKGFGMSSLAAIVGEAGDIGGYSNPAKLWKRFSLHVVNGAASKRVKGDNSQGFVSRRRAEAHVVGDNLLRAGGPMADLYRTRKAFEIEKLAAVGIGVKPAARIAVKDRDKFMSDGQVHKRALRYVEKRLLLELWRAWRH